MQVKFDIWIKAVDERTGEILKSNSDNVYMEASDFESMKASLVGHCKSFEKTIKDL